MHNIVRGALRWRLGLALLVLHLVAIYGVGQCHQVSGATWAAALVVYLVSSLGITVGYHRYFTHGAFQCTEPAKYLLAFMGALAGEGPLWQWVADHRQHHAYTDDEGDPHSPFLYPQPLGFLWAHVGWLLWVTKRPGGYRPADRANDIAVIRWQHRWYWPIVLVGFVGPWILFGANGLWLAGFVRLVVHLHVTWCVNSICHLWGSRPTDLKGQPWTSDQSRNNIVIAVLGTGEGWHGNHHVKPNAADLGRAHWYDPGYWLIWWLQKVGLVYDVRTFSSF